VRQAGKVLPSNPQSHFIILILRFALSYASSFSISLLRYHLIILSFQFNYHVLIHNTSIFCWIYFK